MKPGTLIDDLKLEEKPIYEERFIGDEFGINHISAKAPNLIFGSVINKQGFRGNINYTKAVIDSIRNKTHKKIVMIIGDSFVEGCCAENVSSSFPDLLDKTNKYQILNFGVAGTDPVQYKLIAEKYVSELKPDLVITVFYFGNDILFYERKPEPYLPLTYPFKNNKWIYSVAPNHLSETLNYNLKNPTEAYHFYLDHYTLYGSNRNLVEKTIRYSVSLSKLYLLIEHYRAKRSFQKRNPNMHIDGNKIAYENLNKINNICVEEKIKSLFVAIPAPLECEEDLKEKYKLIFNEIEWFVPTNLTLKDYDGTTIGNHFNGSGHQKYSDFLMTLIESKK